MLNGEKNCRWNITLNLTFGQHRVSTRGDLKTPTPPGIEPRGALQCVVPARRFDGCTTGYLGPQDKLVFRGLCPPYPSLLLVALSGSFICDLPQLLFLYNHFLLFFFTLYTRYQSSFTLLPPGWDRAVKFLCCQFKKFKKC